MDQSWTRARRLVCENVIGALAVGITFIAGAAQGSFVLALAALGLVLVVAGLGIANVVAACRLWKGYQWWALMPLATYLCCAAAVVAGTPYGMWAALAGTPRRPDTFPRGSARVELEQVAAQLLGHSFKTISTRSGAAPPVRMVDGSPPATVPADLLRRLRSYGFDEVFIDDTQSLVVFSSYHFRSWYHYLHTSGALDPAYSRQSTITPVDIETWAELSSIARQGPEATEEARRWITFEPRVVYPYLRQALGDEMLNELAHDSGAGVTPEQRALVLKALNDQRRGSSRLIEHPSITYGDEERFHLSLAPGRRLSDEFWVVKLLQTLLRTRTIQRAEDNRHLLMKADLTELEERQVEWLHVGLMNFLYGNLLAKRDHRYSMELGDGWYFEHD